MKVILLSLPSRPAPVDWVRAALEYENGYLKSTGSSIPGFLGGLATKDLEHGVEPLWALPV